MPRLLQHTVLFRLSTPGLGCHPATEGYYSLTQLKPNASLPLMDMWKWELGDDTTLPGLMISRTRVPLCYPGSCACFPQRWPWECTTHQDREPNCFYLVYKNAKVRTSWMFGIPTWAAANALEVSLCSSKSIYSPPPPPLCYLWFSKSVWISTPRFCPWPPPTHTHLLSSLNHVPKLKTPSGIPRKWRSKALNLKGHKLTSICSFLDATAWAKHQPKTGSCLGSQWAKDFHVLHNYEL